ncbi:MAG: hypothetical protein EPO06_00545 [Burkholderiaceae bacterium]|nr:MAG: hypothetical protein EPO06_00545 [Burkholderiaceae bacterium]
MLANPGLIHGASQALALATYHQAQRWSILLEGGPGTLQAPAGVTLHQLAAQCVCCQGALPLRVTLARIIRLEQPQRIVLELTHTEHLSRTIELLQSGSFGEHLRYEISPLI